MLGNSRAEWTVTSRVKGAAPRRNAKQGVSAAVLRIAMRRGAAPSTRQNPAGLVGITAILLALCAVPALAKTRSVHNTKDSGDGSLRQAIGSSANGDSIDFDGDVRGEIALESPLAVSADVSIKGPGANSLTVRGAKGTVLSASGDITITGLTIAGGETAVALDHGTLTLIECAVIDSAGDGIANHGGHLKLVRSLVAKNHGIGISNADGTTACENSTIADNTGAGLSAAGGSASTASCTIAANGGTGLDAAGGEIKAQNTLVAGNLQGCAGSVRSKGFNLTDDHRCVFLQAGDQTSDDMRIGELADNGGPTQTIGLTGGSPAIDAGNPAGCTEPSGGGLLATDQRGRRRPGGSRCDIGAFETQPAVAGTVVNRILALVDGDPITLYELKDFAAGDPRLKSAMPDHQADVLDLLITKRLIDKEVEKQGIKVQDADIDHYIANIKDRNHISDEQLDAALAQQGLTRDRYRAQVREELQRAQLINREIRGKVSVSDEDIERYKKEHGGEDESASATPGADKSTQEQVAISQIFLKVPEGATLEQQAAVMTHADKIYDELKAGADFATVAASESEDGAGKSGGKLGTFKEGEMRDDLAEAIKGLKPGEFTKPVRTSTGIHIVRVDARFGPGGGQKTVAEGKTDEIKEQLYAKALEDRYNRWLREDLRQRHHVEIRQ